MPQPVYFSLPINDSVGHPALLCTKMFPSKKPKIVLTANGFILEVTPIMCHIPIRGTRLEGEPQGLGTGAEFSGGGAACILPAAFHLTLPTQTLGKWCATLQRAFFWATRVHAALDMLREPWQEQAGKLNTVLTLRAQERHGQTLLALQGLCVCLSPMHI